MVTGAAMGRMYGRWGTRLWAVESGLGLVITLLFAPDYNPTPQWTRPTERNENFAMTPAMHIMHV